MDPDRTPQRPKRTADEAGIFDDNFAPSRRARYGEEYLAGTPAIPTPSGPSTGTQGLSIAGSPQPSSSTPAPQAPPGRTLRVWAAGVRDVKDKTNWQTGIGKRDISLPYDVQWMGINQEELVEKVLNNKSTPAERRAWMASYPKWADRLGDGWVGTKILGQGSFGIAALFELPKSSPLTPDIGTRQVVVKQVR